MSVPANPIRVNPESGVSALAPTPKVAGTGAERIAVAAILAADGNGLHRLDQAVCEVSRHAQPGGLGGRHGQGGGVPVAPGGGESGND